MKRFERTTSYYEGNRKDYIVIRLKSVYVEIEAWEYETRYSWGHKCNVNVHADCIHETAYKKYVYYNRTWEQYKFESVIKGALREACLVDARLYKKICKYLDKKILGR